ncbi:MAG TPA: methyltransferase domain-containing protein [Candidatus Sumerlaeota bacterium]|nr:methyltransferase domain-containing protein [Candidatus Sumerlaeota bacterium]
MATRKNEPNINFDRELTKGQRTYDRAVGEWWLDRSTDGAHTRAYRKIARQIRERIAREPREIIDYACGPGSLLVRLARQFPESRLIGIDGSRKMVEAARARLAAQGRPIAARTEILYSNLPNFALPLQADLVIFAFPNICPNADVQPYYDRHGARHREDVKVARALAKAREPDPEDETVTQTPEELFMALIDAKVISRNLRKLLRKGGTCVRIEYANAPREEMTDLVRMRLDFEAGSLARAFGGARAERLFRLREVSYTRSRVIEDVYHQTRDEGDRVGGYLISTLTAI